MMIIDEYTERNLVPEIEQYMLTAPPSLAVLDRKRVLDAVNGVHRAETAPPKDALGAVAWKEM